jgi:hypothetical protein
VKYSRGSSMVFMHGNGKVSKKNSNYKDYFNYNKVVLRLDTVVPNGYRDYPFEDAD